LQPNETALVATHFREEMDFTDWRGVFHPLVFTDADYSLYASRGLNPVQERWNGHDGRKMEQSHTPAHGWNLGDQQIFIVPEGFVRQCSAMQRNIGSIHEPQNPPDLSHPACCPSCAGVAMARMIFGEP
jgi:hypothetical protein